MGSKLGAASELEDIVRASTNARIVPDGEFGHMHENVKVWEHRDVLFRVNDRFYSGKVNIAILEKVAGKNGNFRKFHDVTAIKDVTDNVRYLHGKIPIGPIIIGNAPHYPKSRLGCQ